MYREELTRVGESLRRVWNRCGIPNRARGNGCEIGLRPAMRSISVMKFVRVEQIYIGHETRSSRTNLLVMKFV